MPFYSAHRPTAGHQVDTNINSEKCPCDLCEELRKFVDQGAHIFGIGFAAYQEADNGNGQSSDAASAVFASPSELQIKVVVPSYQAFAPDVSVASISNSNTSAAEVGHARLMPPLLKSSPPVLNGDPGTTTDIASWLGLSNKSAYAGIARLLREKPELSTALTKTCKGKTGRLTFRVPSLVQDIVVYIDNLVILEHSFALHIDAHRKLSPYLMSTAFPQLAKCHSIGWVFDHALWCHVSVFKMLIDQFGLRWIAAHFPRMKTFYIVDPTIKIWFPQLFGLIKDREKFYGDGCTYIEVREDGEWPWIPQKSIFRRGGDQDQDPGPWKLKEMLQEVMVSTSKAKKILGQKRELPRNDSAGTAETMSLSGDFDPMSGWGDCERTEAGWEHDWTLLNSMGNPQLPEVKVAAMVDGHH